MGIILLVSVTFENGSIYSCSYDKRDFVYIEENMFPRNLKGISTGLDNYGFFIIEYFVRVRIIWMILIRY